MANHNSEFIKEITARGFIHQATDMDNLDKLLLNDNPVPAYIGFDCTAPSLHVGSLIQIMLLRWYQKCGHQPIVLIGGGTTLIGDPSGKDESRKLKLKPVGNSDEIKVIGSLNLFFGKNVVPKFSTAFIILFMLLFFRLLSPVSFIWRLGFVLHKPNPNKRIAVPEFPKSNLVFFLQ